MNGLIIRSIAALQLRLLRTGVRGKILYRLQGKGMPCTGSASLLKIEVIF